MKLLSHVQVCATPWTNVAHKAPPSMGFSMQEYWSGLPFPSPGDLPHPGMEPRSPELQADSLTSEPPGNHSIPNNKNIFLTLTSKWQGKFLIFCWLGDWSEVKVAQSCPTLCNPMDYTVHGILQARIMEWVAFPFSRASSQPRDQTQVSCIAGRFFTNWATRED